MKRKQPAVPVDATPAGPAPWINQFGQAVHNNPWGHYRRNPAYAEYCAACETERAQELELRSATRRGRNPRTMRRVRVLVCMTVVATALSGATSAYAFWTRGGSGTGHAVTTTATVTVSATAGTPSAPLYPGANGDVTLKINNPNAFALKLKTVTGNGSITADAGHAGCSPTGVTFNNQTGLNINLPASTNNIPVDLSGAASMSNASATGCQGATFTIPVSITVQTS